MPKQTPAELDATNATSVDLEFRGVTFTIPAVADQCHPKVLRAFERGRTMEGVEALVGAKAFDRLMDDPSVTMADMNDLVRLIVEDTWGLEPGN